MLTSYQLFRTSMTLVILTSFNPLRSCSKIKIIRFDSDKKGNTAPYG